MTTHQILATYKYAPGDLVDTQSFLSSGDYNWIKPLIGSYADVFIHAGGASGGNAFNGGAASQGGQGGEWKWYRVPLSALLAVEPLRVAALAAGVNGNSPGNPGNYSQFGNSVECQGGKAGNSQFSSGAPGLEYTPTSIRPEFTLMGQEDGGLGGNGTGNGGSTTNAGPGGGGMVNDGGQGNGGLASVTGALGGNGGDASENQPRNGSGPGAGGGATDWDGGSASGRGDIGRIVVKVYA